MLHGVLIFLGLLVAIAGLSLAFLSQRYWFARAWRFAGRIDRPAWRKGIRGAMIAALAVIALVALAAVARNMRGRHFPRLVVVGVFRFVADQLHFFLPVHQNHRRRGMAVEAFADVVFG